MSPNSRTATLTWLFVCLFGSAAYVNAADSVDFKRDIKPILDQHCVECHGAQNTSEGGLNLTNARVVEMRADSGKRPIVAGEPAASELWLRATSKDPDLRMPPDSESLSAEQLGKLRRWIQQGAEWPVVKTKLHWAYAAPKPPALPTSNSDWARNAIDTFVEARMHQHGLVPSPSADPARLLRRVHLDIVGLPPTVDEVNAFVANPSDQHYQAIVDRLLASPRYGEKWSRHWLDLGRYSDSNGYQADQLREMWAFRDWVIDAMNADMPFDQFTIEQLAGDLLPNPTLSQQIATGFHRATTCNVEAGVDPEGNRTDQIIDRVNTTGTTWLATTLECAQCHNHKYDPISQQEYYELFAFFNNTPMEVKQEKKDSVQYNFYGPKISLPQTVDAELVVVELKSQLERVSKRLNVIKSDTNDIQQERKTLAKTKAKLEKQLADAKPPTTLVMQEMENARETTIFVRGNFLSPGASVQPNVPRILNDLPHQQKRDRLAFANWLVEPANPLTARVAVNRWWHEYFGQGIVATIDDFGTQGNRPTHPELLDWLALKLQESDWSMKAIHRLIVTSSTYRQSSKSNNRTRATDPDNRWLARGPRNRLPAELIRDQALSAGDLLVSVMHGPPVYPPQPVGLWRQTGRNEPVFDTNTNENRFRRGAYVVWRRAAPYPTFVTFDAPDRMTCVARRPQTNTPLQALALLNDEVYVEAAKAMSARVLNDTVGRDVTSKLEYAMKLAFSRAPSSREIATLLQLLKAERAAIASNPLRIEQLLQKTDLLPHKIPGSKAEWAAWFGVCNALLNLDETITK